MIILIDNYDSFTYNLYQLLGSARPDVRVIRNDAMGVAELKGLKPDALVLSPGPGRPDEAGVCEAAVLALSGVVPILGVCLGHQAICEALGATIVHAEQITHTVSRRSLRSTRAHGSLVASDRPHGSDVTTRSRSTPRACPPACA